MTPIIHDVEQRSPEWFELRKGKMTASHAQAIGSAGKGLDTYILEVMAKSYSSSEEEGYMNANMQRGIDLEEQARNMYELEKSVEVQEVGFIEYDYSVGCSPDGFVGEDGGIEIKCKDDIPFFKNLLDPEEEIESKYLWQIQMCLLITGRKWWDYVCYNPNFKTPLIIVRITPDRMKHEKLFHGFEVGRSKMGEMKSKVNL